MCDITFPEVCPGVAKAGYIEFKLYGAELLDAKPSEAGFLIDAVVFDECPQRASCVDFYRVRVSRVAEE